MRMYDVLEKKRDGLELTDEEIAFFVQGCVSSDIPDYQISAMLMAIFLKGMTPHETAQLTQCMVNTGETLDLSSVGGITVDKHSTGGVGDKTSLVVVPIVAACGVRVAKMSGRGLGHTGGTLDKLESIPGTCIDVSRERFLEISQKVGCAIVGQTADLAPADKKLYAIRDVTATVNSIPLIASSIMSKKLASGAEKILLDVKTGSGAFMKTLDSSIELAQAMVEIGEELGRETAALVTNMDRPLGHEIGNSLEICEVVDTLQGHGPDDLLHESLELATNMLMLAGMGSYEECCARAKATIEDGSAFEKLCEMIEALGGDSAYLRDTTKFEQAAIAYVVKASEDGFITSIDTTKVGIASVELGAGRERLGEPIDYSAGITLLKNRGDKVGVGDALAVLHANDEKRLETALKTFSSAICVGAEAPANEPLVYARVSAAGVERY